MGSWPGSELWELLMQWQRKGIGNFQKVAWVARTKVIGFRAMRLIDDYFLLLKKTSRHTEVLIY